MTPREGGSDEHSGPATVSVSPDVHTGVCRPLSSESGTHTGGNSHSSVLARVFRFGRESRMLPSRAPGFVSGQLPRNGMQKCSLFTDSDQHRDKLQQKQQTCFLVTSCNTEAAEIPNSTAGSRTGRDVRECCLGRHTCTSSRRQGRCPPARLPSHVSCDCAEPLPPELGLQF